jgi:hypothetical protein
MTAKLAGNGRLDIWAQVEKVGGQKIPLLF